MLEYSKIIKGGGGQMKTKLKSIVKILVKIGAIIIISVLLVPIVASYFEMDQETIMFILGAIYFLVGGSTLMSNGERRVDINYQKAKSIGIDGIREGMERDRLEVDHSSSFLTVMASSGIILILIGYFMK